MAQPGRVKYIPSERYMYIVRARSPLFRKTVYMTRKGPHGYWSMDRCEAHIWSSRKAAVRAIELEKRYTRRWIEKTDYEPFRRHHRNRSSRCSIRIVRLKRSKTPVQSRSRL